MCNIKFNNELVENMSLKPQWIDGERNLLILIRTEENLYTLTVKNVHIDEVW